MAKYFLHVLIISAILLPVIPLATCKTCPGTAPYTVYIFSNLPEDSPMLRLHCASKDDDLGNHTLAINERFTFDFCSNGISTLFYCDAWWGPKHVHFDAFKQTFTRANCNVDTCYWAAKTDGLYFSNYYPPRGLTKKFDWS
ncbi:hypothetical protein PHJA_001700700 [Phtheirospermum japonicum]|uniref:S-protein homolog n=1 Tax=Phtheirospermum japonicum TaxID=374723 RepID=A0A830CGP6_9LAMI|nr:hypothetical protein PHJA_001700700 [Phtheirospermum japonicum]